jgi:hypothetical protein
MRMCSGCINSRDVLINMRGAIVDIPPPFRADPHALGTTLFEGEEDDMGTKEEVKPNFRTPPR